MANLDWSKCPVVESVPGRLNGAWVFCDTWMPVSVVTVFLTLSLTGSAAFLAG